MSSAGVGFLIREMADRGITVKASFPDYQPRLHVDGGDWRDAAGPLTTAMERMAWVFRWGVIGKRTGQEFLCCNACEEVQMLPKSKGAPSQKPICHMTPDCHGVYRRLPEIFDVESPPSPWRGVTWDFDDGGTVLTYELGRTPKGAVSTTKPITITPVADGVSVCTISFRTKEGVPWSGTKTITVQDGRLDWSTTRWRRADDEPSEAAA